MDNVIFLNSSGGIVTPNGSSAYIPLLNIAPYVEAVNLPVVSTDPAALYGDHPENLVTLTHTSGAALTFFVDSVAGGNDSSGNGSPDHPWRSLNTASNFLKCAQCTLNTAVKYIQIKVRGTVDYVSGYWDPWTLAQGKIILAGWGERCDLGAGGGSYGAGYMFDVSGFTANDTAVYSGCTISRWGRSQTAVACEVDHGSNGVMMSAAVGCSGGELSATFVGGGSFSRPLRATYVSGATVSVVGGYSSALALQSGACDLNVVASGARVRAVSAGNSALFRNCTVSAYAAAEGVSAAIADAECLYGNNPVVSGGTFYAHASAYASRYKESCYYDNASALAFASALPMNATANNAQCVATADATAILRMGSGVGSAVTSEVTQPGGGVSGCSKYVGAVVRDNVSSSWTSSGGVCP